MSDGRVRYAGNGDARIAYRMWQGGHDGRISLGWVLGGIDSIDDPAVRAGS